MSGELLRKAKHQCAPPYDDLGAVWRCDCGRRWVCVLDYTASPDGRAWKRRLLPWPRPAPARRDGWMKPPGGGYRFTAASHVTEPPAPPPGPAGVGSLPDRKQHCAGCRCGLSGNLTLHPSDVEVITDGKGNPVAYLYNAQ